MFLSRTLAVSLLVLSSAAFADSIDVNLNNNAAAFRFNSSASDFIEGNSELSVGLLYNDANNKFADAGLIIKGGSEEEGAPGLSVGVGVKGVFGSNYRVVTAATAATAAVTTTDTLSAIAVGGAAVFGLPTAVPVAFVVEYYASPKIMSFADSNRFNQFGLRLEVAVSPQAKIYVGYREIGFGIASGGSAEIDKSSFVGVTASF
ncbi:MAG: YfaZ family [Gallionellaceae bacterium]|nr:MAG: YfaZ family [Gallionellaceae bacterium]